MSCPYYKFESSGWFGGDYYCIKQEKAVDTDTYYKYCRNYDYSDCPIYKHGSSSSGGCFLTSACTAARGLPDDCRELQTLRAFRDTWLKQTEDGAVLIDRYYEIAPAIVDAIDALPERIEIYDEIYQTLVCPCVELIGQGKYQEAMELYLAETLELHVRFIGKENE